MFLQDGLLMEWLTSWGASASIEDLIKWVRLTKEIWTETENYNLDDLLTSLLENLGMFVKNELM